LSWREDGRERLLASVLSSRSQPPRKFSETVRIHLSVGGDVVLDCGAISNPVGRASGGDRDSHRNFRCACPACGSSGRRCDAVNISTTDALIERDWRQSIRLLEPAPHGEPGLGLVCSFSSAAHWSVRQSGAYAQPTAWPTPLPTGFAPSTPGHSIAWWGLWRVGRARELAADSESRVTPRRGPMHSRRCSSVAVTADIPRRPGHRAEPLRRSAAVRRIIRSLGKDNAAQAEFLTELKRALDEWPARIRA